MRFNAGSCCLQYLAGYHCSAWPHMLPAIVNVIDFHMFILLVSWHMAAPPVWLQSVQSLGATPVLRSYVQTPSGGQASSAVELALVADAIRVRSGRPARPYDELVATAVLPDGLPCDFIEEEPEWITAKRRRCDQLEAECTDLRSRVVALEVEVVVTQLVAEVVSRALSELF
jgi:hypothetical protein